MLRPPSDPGAAKKVLPAARGEAFAGALASERHTRDSNHVRILFTCHGAYGHFHPIAPLALAARDKGHEVVVATGPDLTDWVAACGLQSAPVGLSADEIQLRLAQLHIEDTALDVFHRFSTVAVPPVLADVLRLTRAWRPEAVVHEEGEYCAPLFATLERLPCITHSWPAPARPEEERRTYRDLLAPIWAANDLASIPRTSGDVYFDSCPPPYQSDEIRSVPGVVPVRPVVFDGPPEPTPQWLATLPRPAAYVTFGTVPAFSQPDILRAAIEAIESLVAAVVVTTGPNPPSIVHMGSPRIHVAQYLAQSQVLSRVDLVVSHGGAGTTLGALVHGVPHLVMPGGAQSQQRNATKTEELGLGLRVPQDATAERIGEAVQRLLSDPAYRAAGLAAQSSLERLPSVDDRVSFLERLGRT